MSEVANPAFKLPEVAQQFVFQVFMVIIDEIDSFRMERNKNIVLARYRTIKSDLLKLKNALFEFQLSAMQSRKAVFESIRMEIDEISIFLKLTKDSCMQL